MIKRKKKNVRLKDSRRRDSFGKTKTYFILSDRNGVLRHLILTTLDFRQTKLTVEVNKPFSFCSNYVLNRYIFLFCFLRFTITKTTDLIHINTRKSSSFASREFFQNTIISVSGKHGLSEKSFHREKLNI